MTVTARILFNGLFLVSLTSLGLAACGSSAGSGGGSGGTTGAGGSANGSGGTVGSGGSSSGGTVGSGGSSSGGTVGTGGASSGGTVGTGGSPGTGGAAGGTSSAGCGSTATTSPCSKSGTTCSLDVGGTTRVYYVQLPSTYSSTMPYPVVFQFHPLGGSAQQALTEYRISAGLPDAIYVTPQGLDGLEWQRQMGQHQRRGHRFHEGDAEQRPEHLLHRQHTNLLGRVQLRRNDVLRRRLRNERPVSRHRADVGRALQRL